MSDTTTKKVALGNSAAEIDAAVLLARNALPKSGGTLTGPIALAATPESDMQPTTKGYVDAALAKKQDAITGVAGQVVGFDANGKPVAQEAPSGGTENAVQYIEQTLTDEQKAQARANIGAAENKDSVVSVAVNVNEHLELTDCVDGNISIEHWEFPSGMTSMRVTARGSKNLVDDRVFPAQAGLDWEVNSTLTSKGVTITKNKNGTLTCNGVATEQIIIPAYSIAVYLTLKAGTYRFSGCPAGGSDSSYYCMWKNVDTDEFLFNDYGNGEPKEFDSEIKVRCNCYIQAGCTCENLVFKPMVTMGSAAIEFEEYKGTAIEITTAEAPPVSGLKAYADYTVIDCPIGGKLSILYPSTSDVYENVHIDRMNAKITRLAKGLLGKVTFSKHVAVSADKTVIKKNGVEYILGFTAGSDDLSECGWLWVQAFGNGYNSEPTFSIRYNHYFGHCNTVDYCEGNDSLILGNGSSNYDLENKFYIIPNASSALFGHEEKTYISFTDVNAITFDCSNYDFGAKINLIWGEPNLGTNNIAYMITDDGGTIRRIMLGMGTNQLTYGAYTAAEEGEFNGTFAVLATYSQDNCAYETCIQGAYFDGQRIVAGIGHNGLHVWKMALSENDGKVYSEDYFQHAYDTDGSILSGNTNGICVDSDGNVIISTTYAVNEEYLTAIAKF